MKSKKRDEVVDAYVERIIDGMDMDDLIEFAKGKIYDTLETYSDAELIAEVMRYHPDLVEDID
jgi:hypothetical protein